MTEHAKPPFEKGEYYEPRYARDGALAIYRTNALDNPLEPCNPICLVTPLALRAAEDDANADFIVKSCNHHDALIGAVETLLIEAKRLVNIPTPGFNEMVDNITKLLKEAK